MADSPAAAVEEAGPADDAGGVDWLALALAVGAEDGDEGADVGELVVGELETGGDDCCAAIPPCTVTRIPPGWKAIRAVHCPLGAADVAVAVTARLCPGASVPER